MDPSLFFILTDLNLNMKKYYLTLSLFLLSVFALAQNIQQIDSLTLKMCETIKKSAPGDPQERIEAMYKQHLVPYVTNLDLKSDTAIDALIDRIYFRLQKNCGAFVEVANKLQKSKGDWIVLDKKPISTVKKNEIDQFFKGGHFYYKESDDEIVDVKITTTSWLENFEDKTMSKLKFRPLANGEFELEFIESDNLMRKNLSIKGDVYKYGLYAYKDGVYDVWAAVSNGRLTAFRIYTIK
jgi:hypothetical protein